MDIGTADGPQRGAVGITSYQSSKINIFMEMYCYELVLMIRRASTSKKLTRFHA